MAKKKTKSQHKKSKSKKPKEKSVTKKSKKAARKDESEKLVGEVTSVLWYNDKDLEKEFLQAAEECGD